MSIEDESLDDYESLAARFGVWQPEVDGPYRNREQRKPKKKSKQQEIAELTDNPNVLEEDFRISYTPARYEAVWLKDSLQPFFAQALLEDVLALVKGGKEANVYLCQAASTLSTPYIAAKVYRPRQFRNLRNDKMYREGRELLSGLGIPIKNQDNREMRAIRNKTAFGAELTHVSWLMHEYMTLQRLHGLGAAVPAPLGAGENAILMAFVGDRQQAAPVLHSVTLRAAEARRLFDHVLYNIELMLQHGMIHGDLSAYNILYWEGNVTLIDFPQVTLSESNHNAYRIFQRDVRRVCEYFAGQGVVSDAPAIANDLWAKHVRLAPDRTVQDSE